MRWLIRILIAIAILVALAVGAIFLIPTDRIAQMAATRFEAATGRKLTIAGGIHATLWPELGVRTGQVEIANAAWAAKDGPMVRAKGLQIGIAPDVLWGGDLKIRRVALDQPQLLLERAKDGTVNWQFGAKGAASSSAAPAATAPAAGSGAGLVLDDAEISQGAVTWIDRAAGTQQALTGINASFHLPTAAGSADFKLGAAVNGRQVDLAGHVEQFARFMAGDATALSLTVISGKSRLDFSGKAGSQPMVVSGGIEARLGDLASLFAAIGQSAPELPEGLGRELIAVKGQIGYGTGADKSALQLDHAQIQLDKNVFTGDLALGLGGNRPRIAAHLNAGAVTIASLVAGSGSGATSGAASGGAKAPASSGWSKAPIDLAPLRAIDADVSLAAQSLDLGSLKLGKSAVDLALKSGRAVVKLHPVTAYQGAISGQVVLDATSTLALNSDLVAQNVQLQPLLTDTAGFNRLIGAGSLKLALSGGGNSIDALMHSLAGSGTLNVGKGEIDGLDLGGMLTHLDAGYMGKGAKTIFDGITGSFTVAGGVLTNKDLKLTAPLLTATGAGTVGLGDQVLDYTVTPTALKGVAGDNGISVPLRISGRWADPKFGIDMNAAATKKLRDRAEKEIGKKLGIDTGSGGSVEDKLKQKAGDALKGLFGGKN